MGFSSELTLISSSVFFFGSTTGRAKLCESAGSPQRPSLKKVETAMKHHSTRLPVPGQVGHAIGRPTPPKGHLVYEVLEKLHSFGTWFSDLHVILSVFYRLFLRIREKPISSHNVHPVLALLVSQQHNCDKDVQIVTVHYRFFRRSALLLAVKDDGSLFRFSDGIFFTRSKFFLTGETERCAFTFKI